MSLPQATGARAKEAWQGMAPSVFESDRSAPRSVRRAQPHARCARTGRRALRVVPRTTPPDRPRDHQEARTGEGHGRERVCEKRAHREAGDEAALTQHAAVKSDAPQGPPASCQGSCFPKTFPARLRVFQRASGGLRVPPSRTTPCD